MVESADGARYQQPQTMLDALVGPLSFDPLEFLRKPANEQRDMLLKALGLDFRALDGKRASLFEQRTEAKRAVKAHTAQLAGMPSHPDAPAEPVDFAQLTAELERIEELATEARMAEQRAELAAQALARCTREREACANKVLHRYATLDEVVAEIRRVAAELPR